MRNATPAQRLRQIMDERGLRQVDVLDASLPYCRKYNTKLNKNDLSQYMSGKTEPGQDKLSILGMTLNVSEAWLMGFDVPRDRVITPTVQSDGRVAEYIGLFSLLRDEQKDFIVQAIKGLLSEK